MPDKLELKKIQYYIKRCQIYLEATDTDVPPNGRANQTTGDIASALTALINNDVSSPAAGLFGQSSTFNPGDANNNGLNDDIGGINGITARYDTNSAPPILGTPRRYGGDMSLSFNVVPSPLEGRAYGSMFGFKLMQHLKVFVVIYRS